MECTHRALWRMCSAGSDRCGWGKVRDFLRLVWHDRQGAVGVEFALVASILCFLALNGIDVARYIYIRMQVDNAAQAGAQAAWKSCDPAKLPATILCSELTAAITAAVQSTSLRDAIQLQEGSPTEGYYCITSSNVLQAVGTLSSKPASCSAVGSPYVQPGDYIKVDVVYQYAPLFLDLTVARFFNATATSSAYMRLL